MFERSARYWHAWLIALGVSKHETSVVYQSLPVWTVVRASVAGERFRSSISANGGCSQQWRHPSFVLFAGRI